MLRRGDYMALNRGDYIILGALRSKSALDELHGLTVAEIMEVERMSKFNTIYKKLKELQSEGYVSEGIKASRAKTYYLTQKGSGILPIKKEEKENE